MSVERDMKRDGRTLDHKTLEEIRRMAVQRVREGELLAVQRDRPLVRSFFRAPSVAYIADY
jgi:hypothetical protein